MYAYPIAIALVLDFILGDPAWKWHPVRLFGNFAAQVETTCRKLPLHPSVQGFLFFILTVFLSGTPIALFIFFTPSNNPFALLARGIVIYFALGGTCLVREVSAVGDVLCESGLEGGRRKIAMLVSRDVAEMDEHDVISSSIETLAENFSDSACATLFYAALGGPLLAWIHRMANTLDAMVGYKTPEYREFGFVSARFDDIMNLLPARISALLIALVSPTVKGNFRMTYERARAEGNALSSPNAGYPIAAFAGALQIRLCGPTRYFGVLSEKPFIGFGKRPDSTHLKQATQLYWNAYALASVLAILLGGIVNP